MKHFAREILTLLWAAGAVAGQVIPGRYIVELTEEPAITVQSRAKTAADAPGVARRLAALEAQQAVVAKSAESIGAEVTGRVKIVANALIVRASEAEVRQLAALPGVARVTPVRRYKVLLDHIVELHSVPAAWLQTGFEEAGKGIKIAIVDTGIDVNHPGLKDESLPALDGFPKVSREADRAYTNNKVIVAKDSIQHRRSGRGPSTDMAARWR